MTSRHKHISNEDWEEAGGATTETTNRHGLSPAQKRMKRYYNRIGKRGDRRFDLQSWDE